MEQDRCYFNFIKGYICVPYICKFDKKCNGICYIRNLQVNHTNQKYCFIINCKDINCKKNHFLHWRSVPERLNISLISPSEYAIRIYKLYGSDFIRKTIIDPLDNNPLYKALEEIIQLDEKILMEKQDIRLYEILANKKKEHEIMMENIKILQWNERIKLSQMRVQVYINIRNACNEYEQFIKEKCKDELNIFDIIKSFLESDEKLYTPYMNLK